VLPLSDVQIFIDGKACCRSDADGRFKLSNVRSTGTVKVKAEFDGYIFNEYNHLINLNRLIGMTDSSTALMLTPAK
jgi:hypothetical protein